MKSSFQKANSPIRRAARITTSRMSALGGVSPLGTLDMVIDLKFDLNGQENAKVKSKYINAKNHDYLTKRPVSSESTIQSHKTPFIQTNLIRTCVSFTRLLVYHVS